MGAKGSKAKKAAEPVKLPESLETKLTTFFDKMDVDKVSAAGLLTVAREMRSEINLGDCDTLCVRPCRRVERWIRRRQSNSGAKTSQRHAAPRRTLARCACADAFILPARR